jgi:hypothetical protein
MDKLFKKTVLYIVRTNGHGNFRNSAPCIDCLNMIQKLNVKRIVYSTENDFKIYKTMDYTTDHISNGNRYIQNINCRLIGKI